MQTARYALYGNVLMARGDCPTCGVTALIVRGRWACCNALLEGAPKGVERQSDSGQRRRYISPAMRKKILREQQNSCLYCLRKFGSVVGRKARMIRLRVEWDHLVPWSYSQDNRAKNYAAACQVCNGIKADHIFDTLTEARIYVQVQAQKKGYQDFELRLVRSRLSDAALVGKILL